MVLEVIREPEEQSRHDRPAKRSRHGLRRVAVVAVREPHRQQRQQPAGEPVQDDPDEHGRRVREEQQPGDESGDGQQRLGDEQLPLARMRRVSPERPQPEARQEDRSFEQRPHETSVRDDPLRVVGARKDAVVLRMRRPVDVAALENERRQREQGGVTGVPPQAERAVHEVVRRRDHAEEREEDAGGTQPRHPGDPGGREGRDAGERSNEHGSSPSSRRSEQVVEPHRATSEVV